MASPPFPAPTAELSAVIRSIRKAVGDLGLKLGLSAVLLMLVYRRLGQILGKMEQLVARFQAGKLRRRTAYPASSKTDDAPAETRMRATPVEVLPRQFGWLVRQMGWQVAGYCGQLQTVLHRPEMIELLIASPQAIRILRPMCRMMGIDPRYLQPGVVVGYVPPEPVVAKVRVRKPRAKVDWGRIPLPRGMLAAAKRHGFGKVPRD